MHFIVDFYRYAIFAVFAVLIAAFSFLVLSINSNPNWSDEAVGYAIIAGVGMIGLLGISVGLIATFISIHDHHVELVREVRLMREALEERAQA